MPLEETAPDPGALQGPRVQESWSFHLRCEKAGAFTYVLDQPQKPEYIHVLLNHLPTTGLLVSTTALLIALILRSRHGQICALAVIALCSAAAWPIYLTGKAGYRNVRRIADDRGMDWLDEPLDRTDSLTILYLPVFLLAPGSILAPRFWKQAQLPLIILTLAAALAGVGIGAYIAEAGGQVRHPEFRSLPPPGS